MSDKTNRAIVILSVTFIAFLQISLLAFSSHFTGKAVEDISVTEETSYSQCEVTNGEKDRIQTGISQDDIEEKISFHKTINKRKKTEEEIIAEATTIAETENIENMPTQTISKRPISYESVTADETTDDDIPISYDITPQVRDSINDTCPPGYGYGNWGRLFIPDVNWTCALSDGYDLQAICDAWDSGFISEEYYVGSPLMGDHNHQNFGVLRSCEVNYTKAYIAYPDGSYETYILRNLFSGINTGYELTYESGEEIYYSGGLIMYTCSDYSWQYITIAYWERIG